MNVVFAAQLRLAGGALRRDLPRTDLPQLNLYGLHLTLDVTPVTFKNKMGNLKKLFRF